MGVKGLVRIGPMEAKIRKYGWEKLLTELSDGGILQAMLKKIGVSRLTFMRFVDKTPERRGEYERAVLASGGAHADLAILAVQTARPMDLNIQKAIASGHWKFAAAYDRDRFGAVPAGAKVNVNVELGQLHLTAVQAVAASREEIPEAEVVEVLEVAEG